jgi:toxin ParE1/3/4
MPDPYRVNLTRMAAADLAEIHAYIEQDSPQNAANMIGRLLAAIDGLELLPHRFKVVRNTRLVGERVRSMPVRPYLVRYHVDDSARVVTVLAVRHGARRDQ